MRALRAHVQDGRIIVDETTDLPEGTELYLVAVTEDDETDEERAALLRSIDEGLADGDAGQERDFAEYLAARSARNA